jgi:hypothetical protein
MARRPPTREEIERIVIPPEDVLEPRTTFERATTQLERSFGPSCLLSLIIVFLLVVILKRYMQLPWMMLFILVGVIWFLVLTLLVRWRPDIVTEEKD